MMHTASCRPAFKISVMHASAAFRTSEDLSYIKFYSNKELQKDK